MKADIHPSNYRPVIFKDTGNGQMFLIWSTIKTNKKGTFTDGTEYDLHEVEISSVSHPFYTGETKVLDAAGRADKFKSRASKAKKA